jgi:hypothetical protein
MFTKFSLYHNPRGVYHSRYFQERTKEQGKRKREEAEKVNLQAIERVATWDSMCGELEKEMDSVPLNKCYRKNFTNQWSFQMGYTTNTLNRNSFKEPHNILTSPYSGLGRNLTHPFDKTCVPLWKKKLFTMATEVFSYSIPSFLQYQYVFHFGKMSDPLHVVPLHTDRRDVSHQYALHLGKWSGASLKCYDETDKKNPGNVVGLFNGTRRLLRFDGRLCHQVVNNNFEGERYTIICYQLWHEKKTKPDPIVRIPTYIDI